jgi:hypothetical protein
MLNSVSRAVLAGALLSLGACSGTGGGGLAATPTPTPTPATYAPLPLTIAETFVATVSTTAHNGDLLGGGVTTTTSSIGRSGTVTVGFDPATQTYTLHDAAYTATLGPAQLIAVPVTFPAPTVFPTARYASSILTYPGDSLTIFDNIRVGGTANVAPVQLTYLSYGDWTHRESQSGDQRNTFFLIGRPTIASDMPRTGSADYDTTVNGSRLIVLSNGFGGTTVPVGGTATFSANFGTGTISTGLSLQELTDVVPSPIGTYTGTGTIGSGTSDFAGNFTSPDTSFTGKFQGSFYGPQAREMGYVFQIGGHVPQGGTGYDAYINGTVVGAKK